MKGLVLLFSLVPLALANFDFGWDDQGSFGSNFGVRKGRQESEGYNDFPQFGGRFEPQRRQNEQPQQRPQFRERNDDFESFEPRYEEPRFEEPKAQRPKAPVRRIKPPTPQQKQPQQQQPEPYRRVDERYQNDVSSKSVYEPASGPAYATASNIDELNNGLALAQDRFDPIPYPAHDAAGVPAEQRQIQEAVFNEANAYKPDGVYQTEDRLEFQIHGHQGPHSYRYGYDTGNGYNRQFRYEERDKNGYVKGRYGFFDRHGKLQIVNYSADPYKGFHAEGAHVPQYPH